MFTKIPLYIYFFLALLPLDLKSQNNLVLNPNCDIFDTCPLQTDQLDYCIGWTKYGYIQTPDFFSMCSPVPNTTIPHYAGYQLPISDSSFIHSIIIGSHKPENFSFWTGTEFIQARESFMGTLKQPLKSVPHIIEFYVSFSNIGYDDGFGGGDGRIATNSFDLLLLNSNQKVYNGVSPYINSNDIINVNKGNSVINDTLNWVKLSTCFMPKGGETFFAIGTFRDTNDVLIEFSGGSNSDTYIASYYFDNFSIYECDTCCLGEFPYEDHVTISNNPGNSSSPTTFSILINPNSTAILAIYDSAGRLIARNEYSDLLNNYTLPPLANGVYHYSFSSSNGVKDVGKVLVVE